MSGAQDIDTDQRPRIAERRVGRVLIEQPNEDVRELLAEHCRRLGLEPLIAGANGNGHLPDVDLIVAEPASAGAQRLLATHHERRSATPIVFVSIYPPVNGLLSSPAVAYLVMPCSRERFERAVANALANEPQPPVGAAPLASRLSAWLAEPDSDAAPGVR